MNLRAVGRPLGSLLVLLAIALLAPAGIAVVYREADALNGCLVSALVTALCGGLLLLCFRKPRSGPSGDALIRRRDGIAVVAMAWLLAAAAGALPFVLSGAPCSAVDALFESTSGFTTTGATIFDGAQIDALPRSLHFWRCLTHWIGGLGIVLVFVALLPAGGKSMFRSEGIAREGDRARVRDSALALLRVYVVLTALHAGLLYLAGMDVFDAVIHSFSSMATGGFSDRGASIAYFDSFPIELICIVFMAAAGMNFTVWDDVGRNGLAAVGRAARSSELRLYLLLLAGTSAVITLVLWFWGGSNGDPASRIPDYSSLLLCARDASFSLVSVQTCTGYATADFDLWPNACRVLLEISIFVGGCTGSTAGGVKVLRILIVWRAAVAAVRAYARPRVIEQIEADGRAVDDSAIAAAMHYFALMVLVEVVSALLLTFLGTDLTEAISGTISCFSNCGPGLGSIGPVLNYGDLNAASKLVLTLLMLLGRLECYALVALVLPGFWRR